MQCMVLNQCLKLPLSLTNLWYQVEKCNICSAICIIYTLSVCHTHYMQCVCHRWRQTSAYIALLHHINTYTNTNTCTSKHFYASKTYFVHSKHELLSSCHPPNIHWMQIYIHFNYFFFILFFFSISITLFIIKKSTQMQTLVQLFSNVMNIIASINEFIPILLKC